MNYKRQHIATALAFAALLFTSGCAKQELEVSYLYVPAFDVVESANSGDISTQITDVRVVIGAQSLGFYPLPARIPILAVGQQAIRLEPSVRVGGIANNRIVYPFYEVFDETLNLVAGTVDTIRPSINYAPSVTFAFVEDFEGSSPALPLDLDEFADTRFVTTNDNPSVGSGAGKATLMESSEIVEVATPVLNASSEKWDRIWLELDFKGDVPMAVALLPETPGEDATRLVRYGQGVSAREDWRKLYFELVSSGLDPFAEQPFRIGFLSILDQNEFTTAEVFIDNIKVIYQN